MSEQPLNAAREERVEFFGGPGTLLGSVGLRNVSESSVRLRRTVPRVCADLSGSGTPLRAHVARRAVLGASEVGEVPVRLRVPQHTPPGDYEVQVDVGGVVREAVLHVLEAVAVTVSPDEIVLSGGEEPQERRIAVTNDGNIPVIVGSLAVPLDDDLLDCRALRAAAKEFSETGTRFDDFMSAVIRQGNLAVEKAGVLRIRSPEGNVVVQPGETRLVTLIFGVPKTLDRHTRYTAFVPIATADLQVTVIPGLRSNAAEPDDSDLGTPVKPVPPSKPPARPRRAARKTTAPPPDAPS